MRSSGRCSSIARPVEALAKGGAGAGTEDARIGLSVAGGDQVQHLLESGIEASAAGLGLAGVLELAVVEALGVPRLARAS